MSLPTHCLLRHTHPKDQTTEPLSLQAEAALTETTQLDRCDSPPDASPCLGLCNRVSQPHVLKVVLVSQRVCKAKPSWYSCVDCPTVYISTGDAALHPQAPDDGQEEATDMACAPTSDPTFSVIQSLPIRSKSFHLPCSLTTSNLSKQLICLSPIRPESRL